MYISNFYFCVVCMCYYCFSFFNAYNKHNNVVLLVLSIEHTKTQLPITELNCLFKHNETLDFSHGSSIYFSGFRVLHRSHTY